MKRFIKIKSGLILLCVVTLFSACLKKDLPAYPSWDGISIDKVYAEYRYNSDQLYNGQPIVAYQTLTVSQTIDQPNSTINLTVTVPAASATGFTAAERLKVVQNKLWLYLDVSTAATVKPVGDTPKLGDPTDGTKPLKYEVTAANGSSKIWTLNIVSFIK